VPALNPASILIFAQDPEGGGAGGGGAGNPFGMMWPLLLIFVLAYFMFIRPERRRQREHQFRIGQLKKNDRVVTIGGIHGKVFEVLKEQDRVTLKVDEATNTKIDFSFSAIARVIEDDAEKEKVNK
jgi:preprotein translocase subunit YajC